MSSGSESGDGTSRSSWPEGIGGEKGRSTVAGPWSSGPRGARRIARRSCAARQAQRLEHEEARELDAMVDCEDPVGIGVAGIGLLQTKSNTGGGVREKVHVEPGCSRIRPRLHGGLVSQKVALQRCAGHDL